MDDQHFARVEQVFQAALAARDAGGRPPDVTALCDGDLVLAREVRTLLRHLDEAGDEVAPALDGDRTVTFRHSRRAGFLDPAELHGPRGLAAAGEPRAMLDEWGASALGQRVGEFTLIEQIGAGGMGVVFLARQERPQRTVALKLIRRSAATPALIRRFEREAQVLGRLNHPGIAQVYAAGVADIRVDSGATVRAPYIAMEFVHGTDVLQFVRGRSADHAVVLDLVAQVCDAIQHAHQRGVIHRDLKPANILVTAVPGDPPRVKVLDFGVAREADRDLDHPDAPDAETLLTLHGHLIGTLAYMSPEQVGGCSDALDTRCDVYALGAILYQLLADRLPVDVTGCSLAEAARRITEDDPPALGLLDRRLRGDVETIVARAIEKDRCRRYESPAALARDIRHYLSGEPIEARRDSVAYVLRKRVERYRNLALMAVLLLGGTLAFALYAAHQGRLQARAKEAALRARADAEVARGLADQAAAELSTELRAVRVEQGRLLGQTDIAAAERLLWDEMLEHPDSRHARWALRELYWRTGCVATFTAHAGACRTLSVAPDQERFATGGDDGFVRLWSLPTGRKLAEFESGSAGTQAVRFSPDGARLVVAGAAGAFTLDPATGARRGLGPAGVAAFAAQFAANGKAVVIGSEDGAIRLFDPADGTELLALPPDASATTTDGRPDPPRGVDISPDNGHLAAIYLGGRVKLWRLGLEPGRVSVSPGAAVVGHPGSSGAAVRFSPDGATLATGGTDRSVKLWRVADGTLVTRFITYNGTARAVEFSPDGRRLVVPGYWRTQIFEVPTGKMSVMGDEGGHAGQFAAGGRRLVVGGTDGTCRIWDFGANPTTVLTSTRWLVRDLAVARADGGGCLLASIQADGELRLRHRAEGAAGPAAWSDRLKTNVGGRARALAMSTDGQVIVVGRDDGHLVTILTGDGSVAQDVAAHDRTINAVRLAPDGRTLVTGGLDRTARLWRRKADRRGWEPARNLPCEGEVLGAAFRPDGAVVATTSRPASLRLWSVADGHLLHHVTTDKAFWKPVFSPGGDWLAVGAWDLAIRFYDVRPVSPGSAVGPVQHQYNLLGHSQLITAQAFDEAGGMMASVSNDGALRLWDVSRLAPNPSRQPILDRRRCLATLDAGVGDAYAVTFLPPDSRGGRAVAVGYIDGTVRVWDLDTFDDYLRGHAEHQRELRGHVPRESSPVPARSLPETTRQRF